MFQRAIVLVSCLALAAAAFAQTRTADASKEFPVQKGSSLDIEAEYQDVIVKVRPGLKQMKIQVHMEATEWAAKEQLTKHLPEFVEIGPRCFVFVNDVNARVDLTQFAEIKTMPTYMVEAQNTVGKPLGRVNVEVPPGVSVRATTSSGRCILKGDLGSASLRFYTYSGGVRVDGAADDIEVGAGYTDVKMDLTRRCGKLAVTIDKGDVEICGAADSVQVNSKKANTLFREPRDVVFTGTLESVSGRISCDLPGDSEDEGKRYRLTGPDGSPKVTVRAENANITVRTENVRVRR